MFAHNLSVVPGCRYTVKKAGGRWRVLAGSGTRALFTSWRRMTAMRVAAILEEAYRDGIFVCQQWPELVSLKAAGERKTPE